MNARLSRLVLRPAYLVDRPTIPTVPVVADQETVFPVRRIYCVGKNYADHVAEMGGDPTNEVPVFFCKPADAILHCPEGGNVTSMPFPLATQNLHHE